jgi:hypothetical protein
LGACSNMQLHTVRDAPYRAIPNDVGVGSWPCDASRSAARS